ncbi:MAG TPA: DUF1254 domain-containing protein [Actinomycetes bacterium]
MDVSAMRAVAKEAYIYGYPMVDGYRVQYAYFEDRSNPEFKAPWNHLLNVPRVYTAEDRAIVSPNSDTPYSMVGMDLRAEPVVLTVPPVDAGRYFSIQLIDAYTHNFDYIGSRTTGNGGGSYMVAGPGWDGDLPAGIKKVFRSETQFAMAVYRTQLFNSDDLDNVKAVQAGYRAQTLAAFLGEPAPAPAPPVGFVEPLTPETQKTSLRFFTILSFILGFCPTHPSEVDLRARFAEAGFDGGTLFDPDSLAPEARDAMEQGIADAWAEFAAFKAEQMDTKKVTVGDIFGTREYLDNNYLYRMTAGVLGLYGNSKHEAMYPFYGVDSDGQPLTGASRYALRFAPGQLPPVHAFWSLTMYELPESLLVANSLNRYLINSPMLPHLKHDPDGGLTLHLQHETPGPGDEANWLPAPAGPFMTALRLYWPKEEATSGTWKEPPLQRL